MHFCTSTSLVAFCSQTGLIMYVLMAHARFIFIFMGSGGGLLIIKLMAGLDPSLKDILFPLILIWKIFERFLHIVNIGYPIFRLMIK